MTSDNAQGFVEIDHTADIALRVWATSLNDLFKLAVDGMNSIVEFVVDENVPAKYVEFCFEDIDLESMLVSLLNECNYMLQQEKTCSTITQIKVENEEICGKFFHQGIKCFRKEIKAVTYHNLRIDHTSTGYSVEIVFDV